VKNGGLAAVRLLTNVYLREYENRMLRDAKECQGCEGLWDLTKPDIRQAIDKGLEAARLLTKANIP